jgi:hypothetical protein
MSPDVDITKVNQNAASKIQWEKEMLNSWMNFQQYLPSSHY